MHGRAGLLGPLVLPPSIGFCEDSLHLIEQPVDFALWHFLRFRRREVFEPCSQTQKLSSRLCISKPEGAMVEKGVETSQQRYRGA